MNLELWKLVENLRNNEPGASADFVEKTREYLAPELLESPVLSHFYAHVAHYVQALRPGDDFPAWFALQQAPFLQEASKGTLQPASGSLEDAVEQGSRQKLVAGSLRSKLVRLVLNGWLPLFLMCLALTLQWWGSQSEKWSTGTEQVLWNLLVVSALLPSLLSFLLSPGLIVWRRALRKSQFAVLGASLLFSALFFPFMIALANFPTSLPTSEEFQQGFAHYGFSVFLFLLLWSVGLEGSSSSLLIAFLATLMLVWLCAVLAHTHLWVPFKEPGKPRKALFALILVPLLTFGSAVGFAALDRCTPDRSLSALAQDKPEEPEKPNPELAASFEQDPRAIDFKRDLETYYKREAISSDDIPNPREVYQAWLEAGEELWKKESWWDDPRAQALANSSSNLGFTDLSPVEEPASYAELETRIRLAIMGDWSQWRVVLQQLPDSQLNRQQWTHLQELCRQALRLHRDKQLEIFDQKTWFFFAFSLSIDRDDDSFLERKLSMIRLNSDWRYYESVREQIRKVDPLSPSEVAALHEEWSLLGGGPTEWKVIQDRLGCSQAMIILNIELELLRSSQRSFPETLEDLRAEVYRDLEPYKEWLRYEKSGGELELGIRSPLPDSQDYGGEYKRKL